ncbi:cysteine desulfurase family protein [Paenibacillus sp.]|uniref:cysteine desulfurase family protein n=1 Tax=Paenibacillus sp. TaxID=58172 RepID=UPI002D565C17|nr:cysteine desulfurase family protein [Paenibacillus sp.]HZG88066.1 cysteine desulfurase family protein [Paenibacillus sp.]
MSTNEPIYLDHAATTPMRQEVLESMLPYFTHMFGNPSSVHRFGRDAKTALTAARDSLAQRLGCSPNELVFTSGGTESDNLALFGAASAAGAGRRKIVTTAVEHHAVLHAAEELERLGFEVVYAPVDETGRVDLAALEAAIDDKTAVVSVMFGNNEVGTLQPIEAIGELARRRGAAFHVDAVQALGHVPIDLAALPVDLMSFSAHKINGPKGVGLLYASRRLKLHARAFGGPQERGRRAGTENVAGAVGFAKAAELACADIERRSAELAALREAMLTTFERLLPPGAFVVNGHPTERLPHILNVSFPGASTDTALMNLDLDGVAAASGSACASGSLEPSHVLRAMGADDARLRSAIRFSFGEGNCLKSVTFAAEKTATVVKRLAYK